MNHKLKKFLIGCLLLTVFVFAGCEEQQTPYEINDLEGYSVSVMFDANGGIFTTNTSVIVDSYNLADLNGGKIALIAPDNGARGNDAFAPVNNGYFLAGWYTERTETENGYTYSGRWDFEQDVLEVDTTASYAANEPVLTLYAAWVPLFQVDFKDVASGEVLGSYTYDPTAGAQLSVPQWDEETGAIEMYKFPARSGYTFEAAYYDENAAEPITTDTLVHSGKVDYETGTAVDNVMTVYTSWMEGEWYHIYNAEQFLDNASVGGSYVIHADLDFSGEIWPTSLMYGNFSGTILGNGHTFSNIEITQTNNSKANAGLFGRLAETAVISDLNLKNVTFTIKSGTRVAGTSYGLFAGSIADTADITNVQIENGLLQVDAGCYFGVDDYVIGLVCGMGNANLVDYSGITCAVVGEDADFLLITDGNEVTLAELAVN